MNATVQHFLLAVLLVEKFKCFITMANTNSQFRIPNSEFRIPNSAFQKKILCLENLFLEMPHQGPCTWWGLLI